MDHMDGYGQGGWMVLWWVGGAAILILLVWFLWRRRAGK